MILSPLNSEIVRQRPQSTELYLSIFSPKTVMACQITGSHAVGARNISYYNVTTGSISSLEAGMTLLVGTTQGGRELGKIRIRSGTSSQFIVAENGHIDWPSAQHLTVQRYWELWPVFPRIISDPNNDENVIFYKDYDVPYTNQNSILGAFPCAGPEGRGTFTGESLYWSATGTTHLLGSALTYEWAFEGGTPTGSTAHTPGNVTYASPGDYVTRLKVTGANGSIDTTYRYVTIRDKLDTVSNSHPIKNWTLGNLSGSRSQGGYIANISIVNEDIEINDGDVVIIWGDEWYGGYNQALGGNSQNNEKLFFVGHVLDGTIQYNHQNGTIDFQIASITDLMRKSEGFSVSVESKSSPTTWYELLDMDSRRAIYHYLKWHSTVLSICDFRFIGTDQNIQFYDSDRESIFDAVDNYLRGTLPGALVSDRQGMLWANVDPVAYSNPTGSFPPIFEISKRDWMGEPSITERRIIPLSFLEMGGIAYSGPTTGTFTPHLSAAPANVPHVRGTVEARKGFAISGQTHLNQTVGHLYANRIFKYPQINLDLVGAYKNLDIAPLEAVDINILSTDTPLGISIHRPYTVEGRDWSYNSSNKTLLSRISLESLVNGTTGETITIPEVPEGEGYSDEGGGFNFGRFTGFPPFLSSLAGVQGIWYASNTFLCSSVGLVGTNLISSWTPLTSLNSAFFDGTTILVSGFYFVDVYSRFVEAAAGSPQNVNQINFSLISPSIVTRRDRIEPATTSAAVEFYLKTNFIAYIPAGTDIQVTLGWNLNANPSSLSSFVTELAVFQLSMG